MSEIVDIPERYAERKYDLIIVGGGIYGVMLAYEASRKGLSALLLEKDDFGVHTSANSLRIIHGGFRYLQTADIYRYRESVGERRWFLKRYPEYVVPLPCMMPLYGNGLRRPSVLRTALFINDILSCRRNQEVRGDRHLPSGNVVNQSETVKLFPDVDKKGLVGGAVWHDAFMPDCRGLLHRILEDAKVKGAIALNRCEAIGLIKNGNMVAGVKIFNKKSCKEITFYSDVVVNAAGPWSRDLSCTLDTEIEKLFYPSVAWNVLFDRDALSDHALAVAPKKKNARTYFIVPLNGKLFAGTGHSSWSQNVGNAKPEPTLSQLETFMQDINGAVPGLNLKSGDIDQVHAGLLPARKYDQVELADREVIADHGAIGGVAGLYSVSGVKFTTSRLVAEKTLEKIFTGKKT